MRSFSSYIFSCRMRLLKILKHKIALLLSLVFIVAMYIWGPTVYQESWLDPFSTLNVPNRELHPRAISKLGMINSDDPFHPLYYSNEVKIQELIRDLQRSKPLSPSKIALLPLENQKLTYFTIHRERSIYHVEEDFALQYYPDKGIVRFGQQLFKINEASIYNFTQITREMTPGWWK